METISNYTSYNSSMDKSYLDKIFFLDKIEGVDTILDFGCANGDILKHIHDIAPELQLYGYDNNSSMVEFAERKYSDIATFGTDFDGIMAEYVKLETSVLNLSSVIHEVYSYSKPEEITQFWERVFTYNFKFISIRDLCVSNSCQRESSPNDYVKLLSRCNTGQLTTYENIWGSTEDNKNLIHFLMKYRYVDNWEREVRENYFPLCLEDLLSLIPTDMYEVIYFNHYVLPFTYQRVKQDFDIEIKDNTHLQLLLKKKEGKPWKKIMTL